MKTMYLCVVAFMLCAGCGKPDGRRIVDLERRIAALEGRLAMLEHHRPLGPDVRMPTRRMVDGKDDATSRRAPLTPEKIAERQRMREEVRRRLEERREKARAKKAGAEASKVPAKK